MCYIVIGLSDPGVPYESPCIVKPVLLSSLFQLISSGTFQEVLLFTRCISLNTALKSLTYQHPEAYYGPEISPNLCPVSLLSTAGKLRNLF